MASALLAAAGAGGAAETQAPASVLSQLELPAGAVAGTAVHEGAPKVRGALVVHPDARVDESEALALVLEIAEGWHIYWKDPGETGLPTRISWQQDGADLPAPRWPVHEQFEESDGLFRTNGYQGRVVFLATPSRVAPDSELRAVVDLLACQAECIPGQLELVRRADPTRAEVRASELLAPLWEEARASLPAQVNLAPGFDPSQVAWMLLFALVGGLLLNAMPCVLPILAIKAVAAVELSRVSRGEALRHAAAYALGIAASMAVLSGVVIGMRAAGSAVGWGFQFQEPAYLLGVSGILVAFALNLFGVFEIDVHAGSLAALGSQAVGARRSFFEGLLAVVLATPCTAPFLGTAVGFAFAQPAVAIVLVFQAIGLGLALPFALISALPVLQHVLPRSGAWMLRLRVGLGFPVLASALWLLSLASGVLDGETLMATLAGLLALAFSLWMFGELQRAQRFGVARGLAVSLLVAAVSLPLWVRLEPTPPQPHEQEHQVFRPGAAEAAAAAGRPAFVVFTADWCLTCKVNERTVLADEEVREAFVRHGIEVFEADWTRRDEAIRAELARFGRAGVPLYVLYPAGRPSQPRVLPELLTRELLLGALARAGTPAMANQRAGEAP